MLKPYENQEVVDKYKYGIDINIKLFCENNEVQDMRKENQNIWNACLMFTQKKSIPHMSSI